MPTSTLSEVGIPVADFNRSRQRLQTTAMNSKITVHRRPKHVSSEWNIFFCRFLLRLKLLAPSRHLPKSLEAPAGHLEKLGGLSTSFRKPLLQLFSGDRLRQNEELHQSEAATWNLLHQLNKLHRPTSSIKGRGSNHSRHSEILL